MAGEQVFRQVLSAKIKRRDRYAKAYTAIDFPGDLSLYPSVAGSGSNYSAIR